METKDIIYFFVTLYAIVPSIVITVLYSFISNIEEGFFELEYLFRNHELKNKFKILLNKVEKFVVISSKILHLAMSYYLIMLFFSLLSRVFNLEGDYTKSFLNIGTIIYFIYSISYFLSDIDKVFKNLFKKGSINKKISEFGIIFFYILIPSLGNLVFFYFFTDNISIHLFWITITILHLLIWWLFLPMIYKPLTNLSRIKKEINNSRIESNVNNLET